ncbi:MAG: FliH/SctL family protein [Pseudomonadota bacterium]
MVTVIRSARISGDAVTLALQSQPVPAQPEPRKQPADNALALLQAREKQMLEREQVMREELAAECRQVREAAQAEGLLQGEQQASAQYRQQLEALQNLIDSFRREFEGQIAGLEDVVVGIVFEAACKVVGDVLQERAGVEAVVRAVMSRVRDQEKMLLHVSPQDYQLLTKEGDGNAFGHELLSDERVLLGGCLIETSGGTLDGRLETQMQKLRDTLLGARRMLPE